MPLDFFLAVRRAQGLADNDPDEAVYTERDQDAAGLLAEFYDAGFDRDGMLEAARVLGRGPRLPSSVLGGRRSRCFLRPSH